MSVIDINNYIYSSDDKFIIDTNILLYLYNSYNQDLEHDKSKFMKYADLLVIYYNKMHRYLFQLLI